MCPCSRPAALVSGALVSGAPGTQLFAQTQAAPRVTETVFKLSGGEEMLYGISLPAGYDSESSDPRPLILALHPGGRAPYYGSNFMRQIVEPALRGWGAVIVAPDVPAPSWANEDSEQAVLALLDDVLENHTIDRARILVTGFSMGGRGTWYMATRHADLFTGAIRLRRLEGTIRWMASVLCRFTSFIVRTTKSSHMGPPRKPPASSRSGVIRCK